MKKVLILALVVMYASIVFGQQVVLVDAEAAAEMSKKQVIESIAQNMVFVRGGTFWMGCTSEQQGDCGDGDKQRQRHTSCRHKEGKRIGHI